MRKFLRTLACLLALTSPAFSAGTIPFALQQQVDQNGRPMQCLLTIFQSGTVATLQNIFSDFALTQLMPNPLSCDAVTGRLPMFWLADGTVHARLTDAGGNTLIDIPVLQVLGPSSGGGGGGGSVDPTSVAATGDIKWRVGAAAEVVNGWVRMNGMTIGSATSGATQRANADTQNLFIYIWTNCPDTRCPVGTGRGATGLADFQANKAIATPDMRGRTPFGRTQMDASADSLRQQASDFGGLSADTPNLGGGLNSHQQTISELAQHSHTDSGHTHPVNINSGVESATHTHSNSAAPITSSTESVGHTHQVSVQQSSTPGGVTNAAGAGWGGTNVTSGAESANHTHTIDITGTVTTTESANHFHNVNGNTSNGTANIQPTGSGTPFTIINPGMLGTWFIKL